MGLNGNTRIMKLFLCLLLSCMTVLSSCNSSNISEQESNETITGQAKIDETNLLQEAFHQPSFDPDKPCHWLVLVGGPTQIGGATQEAFENDGDIEIGGPGAVVGGEITLFVNGSPLGIYREGVNWRIQEFLQLGKNTVEIKGKHSEPLMVRVLTASFSKTLFESDGDTVGFDETIAKILIPVNKPGYLEFIVEDVPPSPIPNLPQDGKVREKAEQSLYELLSEFQKSLESNDGQKVASIVFRKRQKMAELFNTNVDDRGNHAHIVELYSVPNKTFFTNLNESKLIWGSKLVLVKSDNLALDTFDERTLPCSIEFRIKNNTTQFNDYNSAPPLIFALVDDEWVRVK